MLLSLIACVLVVAVWALLARRLEQWRITVPILFVIAGIAVGFSTQSALAATLNTEVVQRTAEIILAILLFVDATEVRGGLFGRDPRSAARMLLIAAPLSLGLSVLAGSWLLPHLSWAVLLLIACVVVPTDFAPAAATLRDRRIPERVRDLLNVEAGYNDGIVSPIFIFALALAGDHTDADTPLKAFGEAAPDAVIAVMVGAVVGAAIALGRNQAERRDLMTAQAKRVLLVAAPLLSYGLSIGLHGNGFVAAFVSGIVYHYIRGSADVEREIELIDDISFLLTVAMWFVFGSAVVLALSNGVPVHILVFCALALTVIRIVPVLLAMLRSTFSWHDRLMVGWLGPRGTSSIVFGLLAFNLLDTAVEDDVLLITVVVVLGSVLLHGIGAPVAARTYARRSAPEGP